ncbi:MAG: DUF4359 domain-containing protein [Leptolyngbyaceae cyanobacterium]
MKLSVFLSATVLAIAIAALTITNPGPDAYTRYISAQAETYLSEEVCTDLPAGLGELFVGQCADMVASLQPQLETIIRDRTERWNFVIGSIYRTSLGLSEMPMLPEFRAETLGILRQFITYHVSQSRS